MIRSLGPGALTTGGRKNTGSAGTPAAPKPSPRAGLWLPTWAAQGPQDTGAGSRIPYWPRGCAQGGAGRPERAVPGMGRPGVVPGMAAVARGLGAGARHGVPAAPREAVIYKTKRKIHVAANSRPPSRGPHRFSILSREQSPGPTMGCLLMADTRVTAWGQRATSAFACSSSCSLATPVAKLSTQSRPCGA